MQTTQYPILSHKVGKMEGVLYPNEDLVTGVFLHLEVDGEHTTLVLVPSEAMNLRDVLLHLFPVEGGA